MKNTDVTVVDIPQRKSTGFSQQMRVAYEQQRALSIPLNGETYAVVRNRCAGTVGHMACRLRCHLRTSKSADGAAVIMWLEPKASEDK